MKKSYFINFITLLTLLTYPGCKEDNITNPSISNPTVFHNYKLEISKNSNFSIIVHSVIIINQDTTKHYVELLLPTDGDTLQTLTPSFFWTDSNYVLPIQLEHNTSYFWHVGIIDSLNITWSNTWKFFIK